jgi:polysaccharide pyruvyl transferase WcaK-like protein
MDDRAAARRERRPMSRPREDPTHLELRFDAREPVGPAEPFTRAEDRDANVGLHACAGTLDVLLDGLRLSRFRTLQVTLPRLALTPARAASIARVIARLPKLDSAALVCTDTPDVSNTSPLIELYRQCAQGARSLTAEFVLDADADAVESLAAPASHGSLNAVVEASRSLRGAGVTVRWSIPIATPLVYRLEPLFSLARDEGVEPVLIPGPAARIGDRTECPLDAESRLFLRDFVAYRILDEEQHLHSRTRLRWYRTLAHALREDARSLEAREHEVIAVLASADAGQRVSWVLNYEVAPAVPHDGAAAGHLLDRSVHARASSLLKHGVEVARLLGEGGFTLARWARARLFSPPRMPSRPATGQRFTTVLLIGAYGGEHIGDAAILGGVLLRMSQRYGVTRAILMSQRPDHTRHLLPMLETPCTVEIEAYEQACIRKRLAEAEAVVFAGGPLIDLPKQLVKHLYTVSLARASGKPFIAEGIGPGPFPRRVSEWTARRIVRAADRISVRTSSDAGARVVQGLDLELGRDPAFDYLETRRGTLTRLSEDDHRWIERLLRATEGRLRIGLNVRPIRHLFTAGVASHQRAAHTRFVERRFERRLAEGMQLFHARCAPPPCFVFFPMNAIQFGSSDLRSAYRLQRILAGTVDLRVWEADASLDGVLALLRSLDVVITMRFHATIFALAEKRRVIGIDYRIGKRDKVGDLLEDCGQSENCRRIDELTSEWLFERLVGLTGSASRMPDAQRTSSERRSSSAPNT